MTFTSFALASSEWGVARFVVDSIALTALAILVGLPYILLRSTAKFQSLNAEGNALSNVDAPR